MLHKGFLKLTLLVIAATFCISAQSAMASRQDPQVAMTQGSQDNSQDVVMYDNAKGDCGKCGKCESCPQKKKCDACPCPQRCPEKKKCEACPCPPKKKCEACPCPASCDKPCPSCPSSCKGCPANNGMKARQGAAK